MMQFRHTKTITSPTRFDATGHYEKRVLAMAWSPNGYRLAVALADNWIYLFDDNFELMDRFPTKPANKSADGTPAAPYSIRGLAFSPESERLAVAQTDDIVFVYRLGATWEDKKAIVNKFYLQTGGAHIPNQSITSVCWPSKRPNEIVFGLSNGTVKVGVSKVNRVVTLFDTTSFVLGLAPCPDGNSFVSAHADGTIRKYTFPNGPEVPAASAILVKLDFMPYHIAVGEHVVCAGAITTTQQHKKLLAGDNIVQIIDIFGQTVQQLTYNSHNPEGAVDLASAPSLGAGGKALTNAYPPSREWSSCSMAPSGQLFVLGLYDRFEAFTYNTTRKKWEFVKNIASIDQLLSVNALVWKPDGSKLALGSVSGAMDAFDVCLKRALYRGQYEFLYTSLSSVIVKRLSTGAKVAVQSRFGCEIQKLNIYHDRYVIGNTPETLIIADLDAGLLSEVRMVIDYTSPDAPPAPGVSAAAAAAASSRAPRYSFEAEGACVVHYAGELSVIEYGQNQATGSVRTEHFSPYLISLVVQKPTPAAAAGGAAAPLTKRLAYLLDSQAVRVVDLVSQTAVASATHDATVDWLELNQTGTKLLFRDKRRSLVLLDVATQTRTTLLNFCSYVQWVPNADVIVAQGRGALHVWYDPDQPTDVTVIPVQGEATEIERAQNAQGAGQTWVVIDQGIDTVRIQLNDALINFGTAVRAGALHSAVATLEALASEAAEAKRAAAVAGATAQLGLSLGGPAGAGAGGDALADLATGQASATSAAAATDAMWSTLARLALGKGDFAVAQRCYAALQDVAKSAYLDKVVKLVAAEKASGQFSGLQSPQVRALLLALGKQPKAAQGALLEAGLVDDAVALCKRLHKWEEALQTASARNLPSLQQLQQEYLEYLIATKQEERAGELKEKTGDVAAALQLYLRGGFPARAAQLILKANLLHDQALCEEVHQALARSRCFEKAGELLAARREPQRALDAFRQGRCYNRALELCRASFPAKLVALEEEWGDYLVTQRQFDAACAHFMEAHHYLKAVQAAIGAEQWARAASIAATIDPADAAPYLRKIGQHYASARKWPEAEKAFLDAGAPQEAVSMYGKIGQWDRAYRIAQTFMRPHELMHLYVGQAQKAEADAVAEGNGTVNVAKLAEAEKLLVTVGEVDRAIAMYKKHYLFDDMVRLVREHRSELEVETYLHLARKLEKEGNLPQAEDYFIKAKEWKPCVAMYREHNRWPDCLRVAKEHGGPVAFKQVAYAYATSVGDDAGVKFLAEHGLAEQAVSFAMERGEWDSAFMIAEKSAKSKLPEVHLQRAMAYEDEGRFAEAERGFLLANKPREAIEMHIHQKDWTAATRIATQADPSMLGDIAVAQGRAAAEAGDLAQAEAYYLQAQQPQHALTMYREQSMWDDAIRLARKFSPKDVATFETEKLRGTAAAADPTSGDYLLSQARLAETQRQFPAAVDGYLLLAPGHVAPGTQLPSQAALADVLAHATRLALQHLPRPQAQAAVRAAAPKLMAVDAADRAGRALAEAGLVEEALQMLVREDKGDVAAELARAYGGYEMVRTVEAMRQEHLRSMNRIEELAPRNAHMAVDVYAQTGQWSKVLELAKQQGPAAVHKYAANHAAKLVSESRFKAALSILHQHGFEAAAPVFPLVRRIAQEVLAMSEEKLGDDAGSAASNGGYQMTGPAGADGVSFVSLPAAMEMLKKVLLRLVDGVTDAAARGTGAALTAEHTAALAEFKRFAGVAHLFTTREKARSANALTAVAKLSMSLLRSSNMIPVDRAFLEAGSACRALSDKAPVWHSNALVFYNRFIDLHDAISDPEMGNITNKDFEGTDIPSPYDMPLPSRHCVPTSLAEEVRDWVLEKIAEGEQRLGRRNCENCGKETYAGNLTCFTCRTKHDECIVTGFPVLRAHAVQCGNCGKKANRGDWNDWVEAKKTCPWCETQQKPQY